MTMSLLRKIAVVALLGLFSQVSLADDAEAASTIAGILAGLNHFPSDSEQEALMAIARDGSISSELRTIADILGNMQHSVSADERSELSGIANSSSAPESAQTLAEILAEINHVPSAEAIATLTAMR